jgi:hypothetical protein
MLVTASQKKTSPAKVVRYDVEGSPLDSLVTLERPDLGVVLLQAFGPTTPDRLGPMLERTGFVPQSRLLGEAYAVGGSAASQALTALAHMVVLWDDDWADLFLLHLASPDPVARHEAALATVIAALSARQTEPAQSAALRGARTRVFSANSEKRSLRRWSAVERLDG